LSCHVFFKIFGGFGAEGAVSAGNVDRAVDQLNVGLQVMLVSGL
jgi:hypothetical protein